MFFFFKITVLSVRIQLFRSFYVIMNMIDDTRTMLIIVILFESEFKIIIELNKNAHIY